MVSVHIDSIEQPVRDDEALAGLALRLVLRAEFLGCLPASPVSVLGPELLRSVGRCMHQADLPSSQWLSIISSSADLSASRWRKALQAMNDQIEMSPVPAGEWGPAISALGEELLGSVLGISTSSVRRYHAGSRPTPQDAAERLHFVALLLADLAGSYNDYGLRRWFTRPRTALDTRRPIDLLGDNFDPEGPEADQLRGLAASLSGAGAA
jgi:uncharacterized protein (DUF2384 family)